MVELSLYLKGMLCMQEHNGILKFYSKAYGGHQHRLESPSDSLGFYDFHKFSVFISAHKDPKLLPITIEHERIHHHLTRSSTFGWLLQGVAEAASDRREPESMLLQMLGESCQMVHEMIATYSSLTLYNRTDLIRELPEFYKDCFERMSRIVKHAFPNPLLGIEYALAVARAAMMIENWDPSVYKQRLEKPNGSTKDILTEDESPDKRMERMESFLVRTAKAKIYKELLEWIPQQQIDLYLECSTLDNLYERYNGDTKRLKSDLNYLSSSVMFSVCRLLEDILPGTEENYSRYRAMRAVTAAVYETRYSKVDFRSGYDEFQTFRIAAAQKTVFSEAPTPPVRVFQGSTPDLIRIGANSLKKLHVIYKYIKAIKKENNSYTAIVYVTDIAVDGIPSLHFYRLHPAENMLVNQISAMSISLIEEDDFMKLDGVKLDAQIHDALLTNCFVHVSQNPIDFINCLLQAGHVVHCAGSRLGYILSGITPDRGLGMIIYEVKHYPFRFFHLSNEVMAGTIATYGASVIKNPLRFKYVDDASAFLSNVGTTLLSRMCDHPVFCLYLNGETPQLPSETSEST
jgi:hypothetical protein